MKDSRLRRLTTPAKIQDFLNAIPFNFEKNGPELSSPFATIQKNRAHCFEGALLGAYLLQQINIKPYLVHLKARKPDYDHVITVFKIGTLWGALSKTNHAVLRYREPLYTSVRELVMSYFHEYFLDNGTKTLESYSDPLDLDLFEDDWTNTDESLWGIDEELDRIKHHTLVPAWYRRKLRKADPVERTAGKVVEYEH